MVELFRQGGWVMWPLAALSLLAVTLIFERAWFWLTLRRSADWLERIADALRRGDAPAARSLVEGHRDIYAQVVRRVLDSSASDAAALQAVEAQRPRLTRFMPTLGTIITAAPMLGILGTVTGIISAFRVLSDQQAVTDPTAVAAGIAEALLTTVAGLAIALVVLFPFNAFRAQIERALGRIEALLAAAQEGLTPSGD